MQLDIKKYKTVASALNPEKPDVYLGHCEEEVGHLYMLVKHLVSQDYGPFICGIGGDKDNPDYVLVCPILGSDVVIKYERVKSGLSNEG